MSNPGGLTPQEKAALKRDIETDIRNGEAIDSLVVTTTSATVGAAGTLIGGAIAGPLGAVIGGLAGTVGGAAWGNHINTARHNRRFKIQNALRPYSETVLMCENAGGE